jgi:hypothetical protein
VRNSKVSTVQVPASGSENPAQIYVADKIPMRVVVRNTGGVPVYIAHEPDALTNTGTGGVQATFQLPADRSEVFVLAPKQGIYAAAFGAGGQVSYAVSEAIPTQWMES